MVIKKIHFAFFLALIYFQADAQAIDNTASFRMINADRYVRLHYENDYFSLSDEYYTQGVNLEWVAPALQKLPLSRLLIAPKNSAHQFGLSLEHNAYTPTSINDNEIRYGDRPFAATVFVKSFAMSSNGNEHYRITSSFSIGAIGEAAAGHWIQKTIHKWIHDTDPKGWQNQISNDVVLNYEAGVEKRIIHLGDFLLINGLANARAGTLSTKLSTGLVLMTGKLHNAITSTFISNNTESRKEKFSVHVYAQPLVNVIAYDAILQGGVFTRNNNPYRLTLKETKHLTFQGNAGLVINYKSLYMEYFQSVLTKEFDTGHIHHWGGIRIGIVY